MDDDVEKEINGIDEDKTYEDTYTIRSIGGGFSTSVPKKVIERKAKEKGMSPDDFAENHRVKMFYDDFKSVDGAFKFVEVGD